MFLLSDLIIADFCVRLLRRFPSSFLHPPALPKIKHILPVRQTCRFFGARQTCMPKRVSTFSNDLADGAILCQAVASHVSHFTVKGGPLHGFIPVHSTGKLTR